jgi:hypothetical protein
MRPRLTIAKGTLVGLLSLTAGALFAATNSLTISEKAGITTANYPIQIGRPFVAGEIAHYPQALVDGFAVTTQADVKQRWPDGSVKHAIVAFLIPKLSAGSTATVTFRDQSSGNNAPLTLAQMQGTAFNFNAQMRLTNGSTVTADARNMLNAGAYTLWTSGSVAQTIILADHSAARTFDIGFDSNRAFRPIFHATFWPAINKVRVRFIGEITNTEVLEDQAYSLVLTLGNSSPSAVYSKSTFTHTAGSRWTKEFWIGGALGAIAINHNLDYIEETKFSYNFDTTKRVSSAAIGSACSAWQSAPKDIQDSGEWTKFQPTAGARPEIGPYPGWVVLWLYTGDQCMSERALGNADLAASWQVHLREGNAQKPFLRGGSAGSALGHVLSLNARPTTKFFDFSYSGTSVTDKITPVGPITNNGWAYDPAHEPDPASIAYTLTGDFWYLEEMWFWASAGDASNYPGIWERGPDGSYGVAMQVQIRAAAWIIRNRVHAAFITPDGLPEKTYFEALINDEIASEEGLRNITGTVFQGNASWNWGRNTMAPAWHMGSGDGLPPLHQWRRGDSSFAQSGYGIDTTTTAEAISLFEQDYLMVALGRGQELGYPFGSLVSWLAPQYVNIVTNPEFNPYIAANGRMPTNRTSDGKYFDSWSNLKTGYISAWQTATNFVPTGQTENLPPEGYAALFVAATSMVADQPGGGAAWNWVQANILNDSIFNDDPKWAIIPRTAASTPANACDLNSDSAVDSLDVQIAVNQVLGTSACGSSDLDQNGRCEVVDVQRVISTALGNGCRVGP